MRIVNLFVFIVNIKNCKYIFYPLSYGYKQAPIYISSLRMKQVNQSNVAIKLNLQESIIYEMDNDSNIPPSYTNPLTSHILADNAPIKEDTPPLNTYYIIANLTFNVCVLIQILLFILASEQVAPFIMIAITVAAYLIYLSCAYHFSNLLPLAHLDSLHQYRLLYQKLRTARCWLKFKYTPSRNMIDEAPKMYEQEYQNISIVDRSGVLYDVERNYSVVIVKYHKKYFFCDSVFKGKIHTDFNQFVDRQKKERQTKDRSHLLQSRESIEFIIEGMVNEMGFYVNQTNSYKCLFYCALLFGFAIYFQKYMERKVLRYNMDIVKEICPKQQQ